MNKHLYQTLQLVKHAKMQHWSREGFAGKLLITSDFESNKCNVDLKNERNAGEGLEK